MSFGQLMAALLVGGGMALAVVGLLSRVQQREEALSDILDLPWGEQDIDLNAALDQHSGLIEGTIGVAGKIIDQLDAKGSLLLLLDQARLPIRPGEFTLLVLAAGAGGAVFVGAVMANLVVGLVLLLASPVFGLVYLRRRIARRKRRFEEQFPDALTLIGSSLSAGHTFLRAIQLMCEEAEPPISEEFARVVSETQLGDPLVDALSRMAERLDIRDVDWVVQAIRIQQTVGGKLAELLHTLADFIRAREEIRREVNVLTAEGRMSAYVLGGLPVVIAAFVQASNPDYLAPMFQGWGVVWMVGAGVSILTGMLIILRMVKVEI